MLPAKSPPLSPPLFASFEASVSKTKSSCHDDAGYGTRENSDLDDAESGAIRSEEATAANVNIVTPSNLLSRRHIKRVVVINGTNPDGLVWPKGLTTREMGAYIQPWSHALEAVRKFAGGSKKKMGCCGCGLSKGHELLSRPCLIRHVEPEHLNEESVFLSEILGRGMSLAKPVTSLSLPRGLRHLKLLRSFKEIMAGTRWPPLLESLVLGDEFNVSQRRGLAA